MSNYAGQNSESNTAGKRKPGISGLDDTKLLGRLLSGNLDPSEQFQAMTRACEMASCDESLEARRVLGLLGGLGSKVGLFVRATETPLGELNTHGITLLVIREAREKRRLGDYEGFTALSATVGIYPPEISDEMLHDPADVTLIEKHRYDDKIGLAQRFDESAPTVSAALYKSAGLNPSSFTGDGR